MKQLKAPVTVLNPLAPKNRRHNRWDVSLSKMVGGPAPVGSLTGGCTMARGRISLLVRNTP